MDKMTKGQTHCHNQVKELIQKLSSWRDESHRQMSNIVSSQSISIDKGFNDLAKEFSDLQSQVSLLGKERNVLLETINNLNGEIRQMSAKLPLADPEVLELDSSELDIPDLKEECVESLRIHSEAGDEEEYVDYGDILDESAQHKNRYPIDDHASTVNEFDNLDVNDSVHVGTETDVTQVKVYGTTLEQGETQQNKGKCNKKKILNPTMLIVQSTELVCKVCNFAFSTNENLRIHSKNIHSKLDLNNVRHEDNKESEERSELSTTENASEVDLRIYANYVHENKRRYACEECAYASSRKRELERHWDAVHNMGDKKFKCEKCAYSSAEKTKMKYHMVSVHNMGEKLKCERCPYSSADGGHLKTHIKVVHDKIIKIKSHVCEECGYAASKKNVLERHWDAVHNVGDKKFKCEKCPYSSAAKLMLKYHMISVHDMEGKKFECEKCPYSSADKGNLKRHKKGAVHSS